MARRSTIRAVPSARMGPPIPPRRPQVDRCRFVRATGAVRRDASDSAYAIVAAPGFHRTLRRPIVRSAFARQAGAALFVVRPYPSGTVAFLFTDIEGSTRLWENDRAAMAAAVER